MFLIYALKASIEHVHGFMLRMFATAVLVAVLCSCIEVDADGEVSDDE